MHIPFACRYSLLAVFLSFDILIHLSKKQLSLSILPVKATSVICHASTSNFAKPPQCNALTHRKLLDQHPKKMAPRSSKIPRGKKSAGRSKPKELFPMINWIYDLLLWTFSILVDLFFREVHPRGSWKIPRRGPIIFVAAPHANQVSIPQPFQTRTEKTPVCGLSYFNASSSNGSAAANYMAHRREIHA